MFVQTQTLWRKLEPYLLLTVGVAACATSVIFIKLSALDPVWLSAWRLLLAAAVLSPLAMRESRGRVGGSGERGLGWWLAGGLLGVHFITWIVGARLTPAAHSSLIVNMVPAASPILLWVLVRERITIREGGGTVIALSGVGWLGWADYRFSPEHFWGDAICFGSMWLFAAYLVVGKRWSSGSLWLYVVPVYAIAGFGCALVGTASWALGHGPSPLAGLDLREGMLVLGLSLIPTVIGHSVLNQSMRRLRGQVVAIFNLGQFLFAAVFAYWWLGERVSAPLWVAGLLLVGGAFLVVGRLHPKASPGILAPK